MTGIMQKTGLLLIAFVSLLLFAENAHSDEMSVYFPSVGASGAWDIAGANTGVAVDSGLVGGARNPASYLTNRNELYGEANAYGAISVRNTVAPREMAFGPGYIGYLTMISGKSLVFFYQPRNRYQSGAKYKSTKVEDNSTLTEYGAAFAGRLCGNTAWGVSVSALQGKHTFGYFQEDSDRDTTFVSRLWTMKLGLKKRSGKIRWGSSLELPAIGAFNVKRPVDRDRSEETSNFVGMFLLKSGIGIIGETGNVFEFDAELGNASDILVEDRSASKKDIFASVGCNYRIAFEGGSAKAGLQYRSLDPRGISHFLVGVGGNYQPNKDYTFFASAGMMIPVGNEYKSTVLDDVRPWVARAGVLFHGE